MPARRILVVDDDLNVLDFVTLLLKIQGYDVEGFSCPLKALAASKERPRFDMVVSDITMPRMSGMEMVEQITAIHPKIPILFMSGYSEPVPIPDRAAFISKPFPIPTFLSLIRKVLDPAVT